MVENMKYDLQNNGHHLTGLLKEEMEHCGFTKEQIAALCLSFTKSGLMVVDVKDQLTTPPLEWRTHMWIKGDQG
jgi:hypothetical protein